MSLIVQLRCIICNLCIESTQILASRVVCRHIIQILASFCNRCVIIVQRLARYQLVGSRSIRSSSGRACSELFCTKSLAPVIFIGFLLVICCIGFCNGFSIITDGVGLQVIANIGCVRFGIRFQLFHDHGIMGILAIIHFNKSVIFGGFVIRGRIHNASSIFTTCRRNQITLNLTRIITIRTIFYL